MQKLVPSIDSDKPDFHIHYFEGSKHTEGEIIVIPYHRVDYVRMYVPDPDSNKYIIAHMDAGDILRVAEEIKKINRHRLKPVSVADYFDD